MATPNEPPSSSPRLAAMELANMISVPMALLAVIRLGIPAKIWSGGSNSPVSAADLIPSSPDPSLLDRLLRLLASHGVFSEHLSPSSPRRYSLTPVGETLVPSSSTSVSYAEYVLQHHQDALLRAWPLLHESVLDPSGPEPFRRANGGVAAYDYYGTDPEANALMQRAMTGVSEPFMEAFLDGYELGLNGIGTLVDVGGSSGACLEMIMKRVKSIRVGINFDLPEVVAEAPAIPDGHGRTILDKYQHSLVRETESKHYWFWVTVAGVTHVGGDMFKSIPSGDAIFMKWVLTTWTDEECIKILENCFKALPEGGKVIACEPVLPEESDSSQRTRALLENDIFVMTIYRTQGRERSEKEFQQLGQKAGFPSFRAIYLDPFYTILEYQK